MLNVISGLHISSVQGWQVLWTMLDQTFASAEPGTKHSPEFNFAPYAHMWMWYTGFGGQV